MASFRRYRDEDSQSPEASTSSNDSLSAVESSYKTRSKSVRALSPVSDEDTNQSSVENRNGNNSSSEIRRIASGCNVAQLKFILTQLPGQFGLSRLKKGDLVERIARFHSDSDSINQRKVENLLRDPMGKEKTVTSSTDRYRKSREYDDISSGDDDEDSEEERPIQNDDSDGADSSYNPSDASHLSSASEELRRPNGTVNGTSSASRNAVASSPTSPGGNNRRVLKVTLPKSFQRASDLMNGHRQPGPSSSSGHSNSSSTFAIRAPVNNRMRTSPIRPYIPPSASSSSANMNPAHHWANAKRALEEAGGTTSSKRSFVGNPPPGGSTSNGTQFAMHPGLFGMPPELPMGMMTYPGLVMSQAPTSRPNFNTAPVSSRAAGDQTVAGGDRIEDILMAFNPVSVPQMMDFRTAPPMPVRAAAPAPVGSAPMRTPFYPFAAAPPNPSRPTVIRPAAAAANVPPPPATAGGSSIMTNNPFAKAFSANPEKKENGTSQESSRNGTEGKEVRYLVNQHHYAHFISNGSQVKANTQTSSRVIKAPVFHQTLQEVNQPISIRRDPSLTSRGVYREVITTFYFNVMNVNMNDPNCVFLIRFCPHASPGKPGPQYEIHPDNLKVMLNGKTLVEPVVVDFGNRMKKKKNPVYNQPIEVPINQVVAQNVILVRWTEDTGQSGSTTAPQEVPKEYYLILEYARRKTMEEILSLVKQNAVPWHETLFKLYRALNGGDDDIVTDQQRISLHCPASRLRISLPIRGRNCDHVECFDASSFLFMNKAAKARWICPKCNKVVQFDEIVVDEFVTKLLEAFPNSESIVATLETDGNKNSEIVIKEPKKMPKPEKKTAPPVSSSSAPKSSTEGTSSTSAVAAAKPVANKPPPEIIILD